MFCAREREYMRYGIKGKLNKTSAMKQLKREGGVEDGADRVMREREMEKRELLKQEINTLLLGAEMVVATVSLSFLLS